MDKETMIDIIIHLPSKFNSPGNNHSIYYLLYITSGKGTHTIDFKTYPVKNNQLFFMSPGQVHEWNLPANTKGYTLFFNKELFQTKDFKIETEWSFFHNFFDDAAFDIPKNEIKTMEQMFSGILNLLAAISSATFK